MTQTSIFPFVVLFVYNAEQSQTNLSLKSIFGKRDIISLFLQVLPISISDRFIRRPCHFKQVFRYIKRANWKLCINPNHMEPNLKKSLAHWDWGCFLLDHTYNYKPKLLRCRVFPGPAEKIPSVPPLSLLPRKTAQPEPPRLL